MKSFLRGAVRVLTMDVREVGGAIVRGASAIKAAAVGAVAAGAASLHVEPSFADAAELLTAATTSLGEVEDTSWSMGGLIVAAVAVLVAVGIVLKLLNKA